MYDVASGVKVVEVAMYMFVPTAGAVLADWGADVIKIGHPDYADPMRGNTIGGLPDKDLDVGFMWEISNRGKRSVAVDLATAEGYDILRTLVCDADVFLTSFLPSTRQRLRIDVDDIRAINPNIVYARGSGQGARGPQLDAPGFDHTSFWARSGLAHAASMVAGEFVPQPGPALGDLLSGFSLAAGIVGALFKRDRTGISSVVDVSLLGTGVFAFSPSIVASELYDVDTIPRLPHRDLTNPMVGAYYTRDGRQVYLSGLRTDQGWDEFCTLVDRPDLASDPRFADGPARLKNRRACIEVLDGVFSTRTLVEWQQLLAGTDIAWATVQTARDTHVDPQVQANDYVSNVVSRTGSTYPLPASPVQFDEVPLRVTRAPEHGEHTDEILLGRGLTWDQLIDLKGRGVIS
jgi:crotonobetainyl-CoA:carnitine CoA-transferase CaiB-like acyl-CoA transferase